MRFSQMSTAATSSSTPSPDGHWTPQRDVDSTFANFSFDVDSVYVDDFNAKTIVTSALVWLRSVFANGNAGMSTAKAL
ncbi:hypothetical protein SPRG_18176 [Saprolegnia parasitica CBS 223.65]|uniref:Uncharacterized protein n=1 Tax=Saprolegnia parasitica (strain CBS 223.65) TaxID=695850 RepID=A0A067BD61_SAPPC|nr:hypothetical protein SPRG_18176 [Saprolegnia parasitica CBS 223.65]KDO16289.1 hypothetical protein SPRG_18176 [Saprolegnia parasitica CBS 223.65]|eukprot:XP_012213003.1 hypothetical protein SPRG_18176 [Saprolegnia parasitica CBS 223.65]